MIDEQQEKIEKQREQIKERDDKLKEWGDKMETLLKENAELKSQLAEKK